MGVYAGIDIGGMSAKIGLVSLQGEILDSTSIVTEPNCFNKTVKEMADKLKELLERNNKELLGIGIGAPGIVDNDHGIVVSAVNLGWVKVDLKKEFEKYYSNIPISIGNDANVAALGEYRFGLDDDMLIKNMVFVTLGTGIGGGVILDGKLFTGTNGGGGEIGHSTLIHQGRKCNCSNRGCWEQYASATALVRQTKRAVAFNKDSILAQVARDRGIIDGMTSFIAARKHDCPIALKVIDKYVDYIVSGLITITNIVHPEVVLIGGGVSKEGDYLISKIQNKLDNYTKKSNYEPYIAIKAAKLLNNAGIIGSASLNM